MSENMESRVYVSAAVAKFSPEELTDLLAHCRRRNAEKGITGILLYRDGNFVQALEGERTQLEPLMERIFLDRRHESMTVLLRETIETRRFPDWSMGFWQPTDSELLGMPGYNEILCSAKLDWQGFAADGAKSRRLLASLGRRL